MVETATRDGGDPHICPDGLLGQNELMTHHGMSIHAAGDVNVASDERAGTVSDQLRDEGTAAIAVAVQRGAHAAADVRLPAGGVIHTMWTPQLANAAKIATAGLFGAAGSAVATSATASQIGGEAPQESSRAPVRAGVWVFSGSGFQPGTGSGMDYENYLIGGRERDYEDARSSPTSGSCKRKTKGSSNVNCKGNRKGKGKGKGGGKDMGRSKVKQANIDPNGMASQTDSGSEVAGSFSRDTSDSGRGNAGSARTRGVPRKRRTRPSSASDDRTGAPIKRSRQENWSSTKRASGEATDTLATAAVQEMAMPAGSSSLSAPSFDSKMVELYTCFYSKSVVGVGDHGQYIGGGSDVKVPSDVAAGISADGVKGPGSAGSEHEAHGSGANKDEILSDNGNNSGENGTNNGVSNAEVMGNGGSGHEGASSNGGSDVEPIGRDISEHDGFFDTVDAEMMEADLAGNHGAIRDDDDESVLELVSNDASDDEAHEYDGVDMEMATNHGSDNESSEDDGLDAILLPGEIAIVNDDSSYHQAYDDAGGFDIVSDNASGDGGYESGGVDVEMIGDDHSVNDGFDDDDGSDVELLPDEVAIIADDGSDHEAYGDVEDNDDF